MASFQGDSPNKGAKSARFDRKGARLLCSEMNQPLVYYKIPTVKYPTAFGRMCVSAERYRMLEGILRTMQSPCCFAGANDELVVGASHDDKICIWSASKGEGQRKIDRPLRVLSGHRDTVRSVRFNIHSGILASCGEEGIVKLWSTEAL